MKNVNEIELASELAEERMLLMYAWKRRCDSVKELLEFYYDDIYVEDEDSEVLTYTDELQNEFNFWYDHYLDKIDEAS
jgi:hypothetical protein